MSTQTTPPPWELDYDSSDTSAHSWYIAGPAKIHYSGYNSEDEKQAKVDAILISEAPNLLYACQQMMETLKAYNLTLTKGFMLAERTIKQATRDEF